MSFTKPRGHIPPLFFTKNPYYKEQQGSWECSKENFPVWILTPQPGKSKDTEVLCQSLQKYMNSLVFY